MNKNQLEIKNAIGQLEATLETASKYMMHEEYAALCDDIYAAISKLRKTIHLLKDAEND